MTGKDPNRFAPLPHGIGSESMDQDQIGSGRFFGFGYPAMHYGTIFEVSESRSESSATESGFEAPVFSCGEAEALGHH